MPRQATHKFIVRCATDSPPINLRSAASQLLIFVVTGDRAAQLDCTRSRVRENRRALLFNEVRVCAGKPRLGKKSPKPNRV
jgi:hypothetical protein